jgi:hypothetical protein
MRLLALSTVLALVSLQPGSDLDGGVRSGPVAAPTTIDPASPEWERQVEWGLDRFRRAGLSLPAIAVGIHDDDAPCNGNAGLYRPLDPVEVHLCSSSPTGSRAARLITLHELAHAWAETRMTGDDRAALLRLRRLDAWTDPRLPRHDWGAEHAAEIVSWGLMDEPVPIIRIRDAEPAALSIAFELLVGRPPLWADVGTVTAVPEMSNRQM